MRCANCQAGNAAINRFCTECGTPLLRLCGGCGAANPATARFCGQCGAGTPLAEPPEPGLAGAMLERRQVTIVFIDLVGSTLFSQDLDPEDYGDLIHSHHASAAEQVHRFGGTVAQYLGDGILAYFGYPTAHENSPARAVHAGLAAITATARRGPESVKRYGRPMQVRVGIETGIVLTGAFTSGEAIEPMGVLGDAPNVAARLQELAAPNCVVLGPVVARLTTGVVWTRSRGLVQLKNVKAPIEVFDVIGLSSEAGAVLDPVSTQFFGREKECAALWTAWERADAGTGQALLVTGDPGIGKSRLVRALRERLGHAAQRWLVCAGSSFDEGSAYAPLCRLVHDRLRAQAALRGSQAPLPDLLQDVTGWPVETVAVACELLDLAPAPAAAVRAVRSWSAARKRRVLRQELLAWLLDQTEGTATVLVIEDLQWLDASTRELIGELMESVPRHRLLVLMTARPGALPAWAQPPHVECIALPPLPKQDADAMIREITAGTPLLPGLVHGVIDRADGVPLFIEELTRAALNRAAASGADALVPETLRDALMERIDRTALNKAVLQAAAVVGRTFSPALIGRLTHLEPDAINRTLDELVAGNILFRRMSGPDAEYVFRHQLIRDTAYETMLLRRRRQLHRDIADELRAEAADERPDIVAFHLAQGGQPGPAAGFYARAAALAHKRGALVEAIAHCDAADALWPKMPDNAARRSQQSAMEVQRGAVMIALKGYASPDVERCYSRATALSHGIEEWETRFAALWGESSFYGVRGPLHRAHDIGLTMLRLAASGDNLLLSAEAERRVGLICFMQGDMRATAAHYDAAEALFARMDRPDAPLYGTCPLLLARANRAWLRWFEGDAARAMQEVTAAVAAAEAAHDPFTGVFTLGLEAAICQMRGDISGTRHAAERCVTISQRQLYTYWEAWGEVFAGWGDAASGDTDGVARLRSGLDRYRQTGAIQLELYARSLLADAQYRIGDLWDAAATIDQALGTKEPDVRYALAFALVTQGRIRLALGRKEAAIASFQRAAATARQQHAPLPERQAQAALAQATLFRCDNGAAADSTR